MESGKNYEKLISDILNGSRHDKRVRPAYNPALPINVSIAIALHIIENLVSS